MVEEIKWKIEKVNQKKSIVTVISKGEEYLFISKNKKYPCLSSRGIT